MNEFHKNLRFEIVCNSSKINYLNNKLEQFALFNLWGREGGGLKFSYETDGKSAKDPEK